MLRIAGFQGLCFSHFIHFASLFLRHLVSLGGGVAVQLFQPFKGFDRSSYFAHRHPQSWRTCSGHRRRLWKTFSDHLNWPYWPKDLREIRIGESPGVSPAEYRRSPAWSPAELLGMFMPVTCTRGRSRLAHGREDARPAGQQCPAPTRPAPQQALHCVSGCLRGSCFPPPFLRFHPCGPARNPAGLRSAWAEAGVRPVSKCWCGSAPAEPLFSSFIHVLVWDTSATSSDFV